MNLATSSTFEGIDVEIDGWVFDRCLFNKCRLIYRGGEFPSFVGCDFKETGFFFEDYAGRTLAFLHLLYRHLDRMEVERIFDSIRMGPPVQGQEEASAKVVKTP